MSLCLHIEWYVMLVHITLTQPHIQPTQKYKGYCRRIPWSKVHFFIPVTCRLASGIPSNVWAFFGFFVNLVKTQKCAKLATHHSNMVLSSRLPYNHKNVFQNKEERHCLLMWLLWDITPKKKNKQHTKHTKETNCTYIVISIPSHTISIHACSHAYCLLLLIQWRICLSLLLLLLHCKAEHDPYHHVVPIK